MFYECDNGFSMIVQIRSQLIGLESVKFDDDQPDAGAQRQCKQRCVA